MRSRPFLGPPCPVCRQRLDLYRNWGEPVVGRRVFRHFLRRHRLYPPPHLDRDGRRAWWELPKVCAKIESLRAKEEVWVSRCYAAVLKVRAAALPKKLTAEEVRARQVRGAERQPIGDKRRGGENQPREAKCRGGKIGMHNRWHVARGRRSPKCAMCAVGEPVEENKPPEK